jgi:hypothetical protein
MNPSLLGVLAAVVVATGLWLAGRRPRPLLKSTDTGAVAALNRAQNTLVWEARQTQDGDPAFNDSPGKETGGEGAWAPREPLAPLSAGRLSAQQRQAWLRELRRHYAAGGHQRLEAMRRARAWGQRDVLPLLQRGLRDGDPLVMREAARAMEAFRGRPGPGAPAANAGGVQAATPPRNVARTR